MENYKKSEIDYEKKIAKNYNKLYHSQPITKKYDLDFTNYVKKNVRKNDKVLDLGCGPASLWPELTKIKKIGLIGCDISPEMIKEARKYFPKNKFIVADSEKLPFKDEEFDMVICSSVLHHMPSPNKTFNEIKRILKPYGKVVGREPNDDHALDQVDPWITGAIASLSHLITRKEKFTTPKEPNVHKFHKNYKIADFIKNDLGHFFVIKDVVSKYPFSYLFVRINNAFYGNIILKTDQFLDNYKGNQFFYLAIKDGYGKSEVLSYINTYLKKLQENSNSKKVPLKFVKRLILLTAFFDLILPKK